MTRNEVRSLTDWESYYATFFGFRGDEDLAMLTAWTDHFAKAGYTIAELLEATDDVATRPPKYRADHYQMLQEAVSTLRALRCRAEPEEEDRFPPCLMCGGTGMVVVPHPRNANYTCAVKCGCSRGINLRNDMMTLSDYERSHPGWRTLQAEQEAIRKAKQRATAVTRAADSRLGAILGRIGQLPGKEES